MTEKETQQIQAQWWPSSRDPKAIKGSELAAIFTQRDELHAAMIELLPFATEDYYESCATPGFRHAVERARKALGQ